MGRTRTTRLAVVAGTAAALGVVTTTPGSAVEQKTSDRAADFVVTVPALGPSGSLGSLTFCDTAAKGMTGFDPDGCRTTNVAGDTDNRLHLFLKDPSDTYSLVAEPWSADGVHAAKCALGTTHGFVLQAVGVSQGARVRAIHDGTPEDVDHDNNLTTPNVPQYSGDEQLYPGPTDQEWIQPTPDSNRSPGFALCFDLD